MAFYETVVIARQDISAAQSEALIDGFQQHLTNAGGRIGRREYWGLRSLAYRIRKNRKGHYTLLNYQAPHEAVQEMERNMRLSEDVLRYMTLRTDDLPEEPSVVMRRREERGPSRDRHPDRGPRRSGRRGEDEIDEREED